MRKNKFPEVQDSGSSTHSSAKDYVAAGLSVIPISSDGSKTPDMDCLRRTGKKKAAWKPFQSQPPTQEQLDRWFQGNDLAGIGIVCGKVSGGLEVLDFDDPKQFGCNRRCALTWTSQVT